MFDIVKEFDRSVGDGSWFSTGPTGTRVSAVRVSIITGSYDIRIREIEVYGDYYTSLSAGMSCIPSSGTLPFTTNICLQLNNIIEHNRTVAGSLNLTLANGTYYSNWRAGYTNLSALEEYSTCWNQHIPAFSSLIGQNDIAIFLKDVTSSPYNQPPYPPSGDTDTASCTVTGIAP